MVVVDRLSKYAHFMALQHPFTASTIAQVFLDNVYKLHVLPESIISDRDKVLLSHFWQSLFKVLKVQLKLSNAYHPQTDGQTEIDIVGYKLDLPDNSQVRHVFHVSQLKLCKGSANKMGMLPHCGPNGLLTAEPIAILDRRMKKVNNRVAVYVLVKWSNHTDEDATWELYSDLLQRFPYFKESF
ncbi:reverse transcriptase [Tanacetum coccineum]